MSADYDEALVEKAARELIGADDDWTPPGGSLMGDAWAEALTDARIVLDAVARIEEGEQ